MKLFFIYISLFLITSFSPSFANKPSPPLSDSSVLRLSLGLSLYPPALRLDSPSSVKYFDNYYRKLNEYLLKRNPVNDAKVAFKKMKKMKKNKTRYFTLSISNGMSNFPSIRNSRNTFKPYKEYNRVIGLNRYSKTVGLKFLQGTILKRPSGYISYNTPSKIVDLYAKNAARYTYYWNRTMHHELIKMSSSKHNKLINAKESALKCSCY